MHSVMRFAIVFYLAAGGCSTSLAADPEAKPVEIRRGHVPSYPRVFTGQITDSDGKPVPDALIEWGPDYPEGAPRETTQSRRDGTYRLEVKHAGGRYKLGVSAAGFAPSLRMGLIPGPRDAPSKLDFKLSPETVLEVTLVDEAGMPISDLEVFPMTPQTGGFSSFSPLEDSKPIPGHDHPVPCDEDGVCVLRQLLIKPVPPQSWLSLRITQEGDRVYQHPISYKEFMKIEGKLRLVIPNDYNPDLKKLYDGTIFGQVVDDAGQPVKDYHVTFRYKPEPFAVSNPTGRFEWGGKLNPLRSIEVRIFAKGFAVRAVNIIPGTTSADKPERIELTPQKSAEFQLLDGETGKPIPNVQIVAGVTQKDGSKYVEWPDLKNYADGHHGFTNVLRVTSDAEGRITVPEGTDPATLIILTADYGRKIVSPALRPAANDQGVTPIVLMPAAAIHGVAAPGSRLESESDGISLHFVSDDGFEHMYHSLKRDENGECLIESLAAGKYVLALVHGDGNWSSPCWRKYLTLNPGQTLQVPLGELTGTLTLSGRIPPFTRIWISRKLPRPNAKTLKSASDVTGLGTISDIDGYFELDHLETGEYQIELGSFKRQPMGKVPKEITLSKDTHIDYETGDITYPPAKAK